MQNITDVCLISSPRSHLVSLDFPPVDHGPVGSNFFDVGEDTEEEEELLWLRHN